MVPDSRTGRMRPPTDQEVTDAPIGKDSRRILNAKSEAERLHQERVDVRRRQQDREESFAGELSRGAGAADTVDALGRVKESTSERYRHWSFVSHFRLMRILPPTAAPRPRSSSYHFVRT
jgi:hypothetical protein